MFDSKKFNLKGTTYKNRIKTQPNDQVFVRDLLSHVVIHHKQKTLLMYHSLMSILRFHYVHLLFSLT